MIQLRMQFLAVAVMVLALAACTTTPNSPRQVWALSVSTVETMAETAEIAYRDGHIDGQTRDEIAHELQTTHDLLEEARFILDQDGEPETQLKRARAILEAIDSVLRKRVPDYEPSH